ncbi:hypothetical protein [Streptomyces sp. NPDC091299]|uniref:hypothetical protein n=1 Tax=Streptomyces sp. NPDC091299 TaxID=3155302 RepID=UPI003434E87B
MDDPGRYRVTLTAEGEPVMLGWWDLEATARRKYARLIGEQGSRAGAHVSLVDTETGNELASWPPVVGDAP